MKTTLALGFGLLCIVLALVYGLSGQMLSSIPERSANIARWENELVAEQKTAEALIAETDKLGKKPDATPVEREQFQSALAHLEQKTSHLRSMRDMIDYERDHRKQQTLITIGLSALGLVSIISALLLRRRRAR